MLTYDEYAGSFKVSCAQIRVSDPCYEQDSEGGYTINNALNGEWLAFYDYGRDNYVSKMWIIHSDYANIVTMYGFKEMTCVDVDSAQLGMFDKIYYDKNQGGEYNELDTFYGKCCKITNDKDCGIVDNAGVVSSSGYGDGSYSVNVCYNKEGYVIGVCVEFMCEDEDDYEEY